MGWSSVEILDFGAAMVVQKCLFTVRHCLPEDAQLREILTCSSAFRDRVTHWAFCSGPFG